MTFCNEISPRLNHIINHYWYAEGGVDNQSFQLLPMDHIDIVICLKGSFSYVVKGEVIQGETVMFQGIRQGPITLIQDGYVEAVGISFKPSGFYPIIQNPVDIYSDKVIPMQEVHAKLARDLANIHDDLCEKRFDILEGILMKHYKEDEKYLEYREFIDQYILEKPSSVDDFIQAKNVARRTFERHFKKYVGVSPKIFARIRQFENVTRQMMDDDHRMIDLAYSQAYYDQSHFIKDFKNLSNYQPSKFKKEKPGMKNNMTFK